MTGQVAKRQVAEATSAWLTSHWNTGLTIVVVDEHGISWLLPRAAYDAVLLKGAISDARAGIANLGKS